MNRLFTVALICSINLSLKAQVAAPTGSPLMQRFHSFNTFQLLTGSTTTSFAINSVNGFQYKKLFAGVGIGFDYYYHTTIPLFAEGRLDLGKRKGKFQVFANGGLGFAFSSPNRKFEINEGHYRTAGLYAAGIDYLVPAKKDAFILGIAFSYKQVVQMRDNNIWNPVLNRIENTPIKDQYSLNRIAIRAGWMF
jgi:hypothetical protein